MNGGQRSNWGTIGVEISGDDEKSLTKLAAECEMAQFVDSKVDREDAGADSALDSSRSCDAENFGLG